MSGWALAIPEVVRLRAESLGASGRQWLDALDGIVTGLEQTWSVRFGRVLSGGSESLVAEVERSDGGAAVVKVGLPGSADLSMEARVYRLAIGRGYARLLEYDEAANAILLERLGEPLARLEASIDVQLRTLCATLRESWVPLAGTEGLMTGAEKARWLADFIMARWHSLDRPCAERTVALACDHAAARASAFTPENAVLVHGDAHAMNALVVPGEPGRYRFVDPDGLFAEPACDLAVPMRDWNEALLAGDTVRLANERCDLLAALTGADRTAIWQWGFVERVSTGLVLLEVGMKDEARAYLGVADRLALA